MRSVSYRTRQRIRKGVRIGLIAAAIGLLLLALTVIYMGRFVVYTPEGARLDFGRSTAKDVKLPDTPETGEPGPSISIEYASGNARTDDTELISGYYIDLQMLQEPEAILEAVKELSGPCTVMIDLKGGNGSFYYTTSIDGARQADINISAVDQIISQLRSRGFHMVARIKTFEDSNFALAHIGSSLRTGSGALWVGGGFYWLDPADDTVMAYLKQIARELTEKGFQEIVFDDFRFPNGSQISYAFDKTRPEIIADAERDLLNFFASSSITISFGNPSQDFVLTGSSRVYVSDVTGSGVKGVVTGFSGLESPQTQLVFLTGSKDRRFEGLQLLRPLVSKLIQ